MCCKHCIDGFLSDNTGSSMCGVRGGHMHVKVLFSARHRSRFCGDGGEQREKNKFCPQGADVLEHRKTLNKVGKMHYMLYFDTYRKRGNRGLRD